MNIRQDRIQMNIDIKQAAKNYKQLVGKTFMYVFDERYIEVIFSKENFKHFTGVETKLSASRFYAYAQQGILSDTQFTFSPRHPFHLAKKKTDHIINIPTLATGECFMLEDVTTQSEAYKFASTDLEITLLFEKEKNNNADDRDYYFAKSLRVEDCFKKSANQYIVTHIFSKSNTSKKYDNLLFMDKKATLDTLPPEIKKRLSDGFFPQSKGNLNSSSLQENNEEKWKYCLKVFDANPDLKARYDLVEKEYLKKSNLNIGKDAPDRLKYMLCSNVLNSDLSLKQEFQKAMNEFIKPSLNTKPTKPKHKH